jgi:bifunctional UDP-N-acetylglucosamine pyrophosphorylase / glucosamine-1-phosphate N-acetyltransferase
MKTTSVILAAGQGTRMRSQLPKVLHLLAGQPMIQYALRAAAKVSPEKPLVVTGHGAEAVHQAISEQARFVTQEQQLGTGHAVQVCEPVLKGNTDLIVVTYADMPLLTGETLQKLVALQAKNSDPISMLTVTTPNPRGFGRVARAADGQVVAIIEEAQATPEQLLIQELNVGAYCFSADWLWQALAKIKISPKGEYYLTDLVGIAVGDGLHVEALNLEDPEEALGINNRVHLAEAEAILRRRINRQWMLAGVTLLDPERTYIESGVEIGMDTVLYPDTYLRGKTSIGSGCEIGPNTIIQDTSVGEHCKILASVLEGAVVEDQVSMGPFGHLRKGAHLAKGVHMGNFGEVKSSYLGPGTKMGHFSYIGDATIGEDVNIGAGTVTCNFDGEHKHATEIGAHAFIGSDTMLVAPIKIGEGAHTGAGSVVTHDVPDHSVVVGVPARPLVKHKDGE